MAIVNTGELSVELVNAELGRDPQALISLNDLDVRTLASIPAADIAFSDLYGKAVVGAHCIYYGLSSIAAINEIDIIRMSTMHVDVFPYTFSLDAEGEIYMYCAAPQSMGAISFTDVTPGDMQFVGGWDGAHNNLGVYGPIKMTIGAGAVPYYVYRTDQTNLGPMVWEVKHDISPNYAL